MPYAPITLQNIYPTEATLQSNPRGKRRLSDKFTIYSLNSVNETIEGSKLNGDQLFDLPPELRENKNNLHILRYTVTTGYQIRLAHEGSPGLNKPAHEQLLEDTRGIAAGNLIYRVTDNNVPEIVLINNKSGDFTPNLETVYWPLAVLFVLAEQEEFTMAEELYVHALQRETLKISTEALKAHVTQTLSEDQKQLIQANQLTKNQLIEHSPTENTARTRGFGTTRRALFSGDSASYHTAEEINHKRRNSFFKQENEEYSAKRTCLGHHEPNDENRAPNHATTLPVSRRLF